MQCGIMRIEKRSRQAVPRLEAEANRTKRQHEESGLEFVRSDIDWNKTDENIRLVSTEGWYKAVKHKCEETGARLRSDSIVILDGLYTASPEFFSGKSRGEIEQYFRDCLQFHIKTYCHGDESLILNAVVHLDEATPHMQVASVPLVERTNGKYALSAKEVCGGPADYRRRQEEFFVGVSSRYGLDRGERSDPAHRRDHLDVQQYKLKQDAKRLAEADRALQARSFAQEALKKTARPEVPIQAKPVRGLFKGSDEVQISAADFERAKSALAYSECSKHYERAVAEMQRAMNDYAAGPRAQAERSLLVAMERDKNKQLEKLLKLTMEQSDKYEALRRGFPEEVERMEQELARAQNRTRTEPELGL